MPFKKIVFISLVLLVLFFVFVHELYVSVFSDLEQTYRLLASYTVSFTLIVLIINLPKNFKKAFELKKKPFVIKPVNEEETPHGDFSGTIDEKLLPPGYNITYENAWQKPVINYLDSKDIKAIEGTTKWTTIEFGNSTVIIVSEETASNPHLYYAKNNFKILVKYLGETKILFGY